MLAAAVAIPSSTASVLTSNTTTWRVSLERDELVLLLMVPETFEEDRQWEREKEAEVVSARASASINCCCCCWAERSREEKEAENGEQQQRAQRWVRTPALEMNSSLHRGGGESGGRWRSARRCHAACGAASASERARAASARPSPSLTAEMIVDRRADRMESSPRAPTNAPSQ